MSELASSVFLVVQALSRLLLISGGLQSNRVDLLLCFGSGISHDLSMH